jgi:hypothetical protein
MHLSLKKEGFEVEQFCKSATDGVALSPVANQNLRCNISPERSTEGEKRKFSSGVLGIH